MIGAETELVVNNEGWPNSTRCNVFIVLTKMACDTEVYQVQSEVTIYFLKVTK